MKIAMISDHASPLADLGGVDAGGQNVYVAQTAHHLADLGHEVDIYTRRDDSSLPAVVHWRESVRVIHIDAGPPRPVPKEELLPYIGAFTTNILKRLIADKRPPALVHAHFWMSALSAQTIRLVLRIPFVVTFHALGRVRRFYQGEADRFPDVRMELEDEIIKNADAIIAECPQDRVDLTTLYRADPAKIAVVPCGFDSGELSPVPRPIARYVLGMDPEEQVILQLGRMVPRKGVDNVIRGFARLAPRHKKKTRLYIVGGDTRGQEPQPELARLLKIARDEGVSDRVAFTGAVPRDLLKFAYSAADIFVTTPWYEPFGITPLEAMACGVPVIGSRVGGIMHSVQDGFTGFTVPPKDPPALADKLSILLSSASTRRAFGDAGRRRVNELFRWDGVSREIADVYKSVVDGESVSPLTSLTLSTERGFRALYARRFERGAHATS